MTKKTLFSGTKPSGELHIGNYLGALKNWVALQSTHKTIYSIVDYHALTEKIEPGELAKNIRQLAVDLLAVGIDPKKSILFVQSQVPEHTELAWIFNCLTPVAELERMTQYKAFVTDGAASANAGLFTYPVLQAADILIYKAEFVPVGEDQLQHLELARLIARKFNSRYETYFKDIKPILSQQVRVMSLNAPNKKMSKSMGAKSYIALRDNPAEVERKISKAVTDSMDVTTTLTGGHNLLMLYKSFAKTTEFESMRRAYKLKTLSYSDLKKKLTKEINAFLKPIQIKQQYYDKRPAEVNKILLSGAKQARVIAQKNLKEIRNIIGL